MISSRMIARLRNVAAVAAGMAFLVVLSVYFTFALLEQDMQARSLIEATVLGALIGALIAAYELIFVEGRYGRRIRSAHFVVTLSLSAAVYLVIITGAILVYEAIAYGGGDPGNYLGVEIDHDTALILDIGMGFVGVSLLLFFVTIRRVIGSRQLGNIVLGRYRTGIYEERVFLFLDIEVSTQLAEDLGDLGAYKLISTFFFDIDEAILDFRGEAHRYIGDEVVITWPLKVGLRDANCLRCFFAIEDIVRQRAEVYQARFGRVPKFRGGLHCGRVVAGFSGDSKRQISYFGDTVNTAARIEKVCREADFNLVASAEVVNHLDLPAELEAVALGAFELRGKSRGVDLFGIQRRT